jgi:hypothetical protein
MSSATHPSPTLSRPDAVENGLVLSGGQIGGVDRILVQIVVSHSRDPLGQIGYFYVLKYAHDETKQSDHPFGSSTVITS